MKKSLLLIVLLCGSIPVLSADRYNPRIHKQITREQLVGFVREAVAFAKIYGNTTAFREFRDKQGLFVRGELYIYAYDMRGIVLSHGQNTALIGKDLTGLKDPSGLFIIQKQISLIRKNGKGWLYYYWFHPVTRRISKKLGYFEKVDDNWWLGSGIYLN